MVAVLDRLGASLLSCVLASAACSASSASSSDPALPTESVLPPARAPEPPPADALLGLPAADEVLSTMRLVNAHFVAKWPDPTIDIVTDKVRPSNLWTRAVYYEGLMALHAVEPEPALKASYYDYAVRW